MKRPMLWLLIAYIAGILLAQYDGFVFGIVALMAFGLIYYFYKTAFVAFMAVSMVLGYALMINSDTEEYLLNKAYIRAVGRITELTKASNGNTLAVLETDKLLHGNDEYNEKFRLRLYIDDNDVSLGQMIAVQGRLSAPAVPTNPGGLDQRIYFKKNKLDYFLMAEVLDKGSISMSPLIYIRRLQSDVSALYAELFPQPYAGIMQSMIIGDTGQLEDNTEELYRVSGIIHVLAISGMHVTVVAYFLHITIGKLKLRRYLMDIIVMALVLFYCLMTGAVGATVRATIMCLTVIMGGILRRDNDILSALSFACLAMLIYEPVYLLDVGFQYSFATVFAMVSCSEPLERALLRLTIRLKPLHMILTQAYVRKYFASCLVATIVTWPITAYHFYYIPLYSLFANIIIAGSAFLITVVGFLTGFTAVISLVPATVLSWFCIGILKFYYVVTEYIYYLPYAELQVESPSVLFIVCIYLFLGAISYTYSAKTFDKLQKRKRHTYAAAIALAISFGYGYCLPKGLSMTLIDVGQADALFFQKGRLTFMVDGGGNRDIDFGKNTGITTVMPFLKYKGVKKLDAAFITHFDEDHAMGILELAAVNMVANVYLPGNTDTKNVVFVHLKSICEINGIPITYINSDMLLQLKGGIEIECIYPGSSAAVEGGNDSSLVLRLRYGEATFLLTGDVELETEKKILESGMDISAHVLKLAHHGSNTSNTADFLEKVSPKIAVVSTGRNNTYGHPSPKVIERLGDIPIYNTAEKGAITIQTNGKSIKVRTVLK